MIILNAYIIWEISIYWKDAKKSHLFRIITSYINPRKDYTLIVYPKWHNKVYCGWNFSRYRMKRFLGRGVHPPENITFGAHVEHPLA